MAEIVKLEKLPAHTIDLRKDNRIGSLLEEYEDARVIYLEANRVLEELKSEIKAKMAGSEKALVDGWRLTMPWQHRREYVVKAADFQVLRITRRSPKKRDEKDSNSLIE